VRRSIGWLAIACLLAICVVAVVAYGKPVPNASLEARTHSVAATLRCPVCQGESVADSPSGLAKSMRAIIHRRLRAGQSPDRIRGYFASRYGAWVLLSPPQTGVGTIAWLAPPVLVLGGTVLLVLLLLSWRGRSSTPVTPNPAALARVRAELAAESDRGM